MNRIFFSFIFISLVFSDLHADVVTYDFESNSYTQLVQYLTPYYSSNKAEYAFQRVEQPVRAGCYAARFEVRKGDCGYYKDCDGDGNDMNRAELSEETFYLRSRESAYYGFSIFITNEMTDAQDWRLITQWHSKPDVNNGEEWLNPVLACRYTEGDIIFTKSYHTHAGSYVKNEIILRLQNIEKNRWHDFVVHLVWTPDVNGMIEIWRGQQRVLHQLGNVGLNHHGDGVYWKFGLYRTEVDNSVDAVYVDELRRGINKTSVTPVDKDCKHGFAISPIILPLLLSE